MRDTRTCGLDPSLFRFLLMLAALLANTAHGTAVNRAESTLQRLSQVAVPFIANSDPNDPRFAYYATLLNGTVFITRQGQLVYALPRSSDPALVPQPSALQEHIR